MEKLEPSHTAGGSVKCVAIVRNSLVVSQKVKHRMLSDPTVQLLDLKSKNLKQIILHQCSQHYSQYPKVETTTVSIGYQQNAV